MSCKTFCISAIFVITWAMYAVVDCGTGKSDVRRSVIRNYTDCGSAGKILQVTMLHCANPPCKLKVGETYILAAYFRSKKSHQSIQAEFVVYGAQNNKTILSLTTAVDLEKRMIGAFGYPLYVTRDIGNGPATLQVKVGENGVNEMCFQVAAVISS